MRSFASVLLLLPTGTFAAELPDFQARLAERYVDYQWTPERTVAVDLNRDGAGDLIALGLQTNRVMLFIELGGIAEPIVVTIPVDAGKQFGICPGSDARISVHEQSEAPLNALGENPQGYEVCPQCFEIEVGSDSCDPLRFFWDLIANQLSWWRA
jgi:hypothetical protein